jgi:hypothetical protein
VASGSPKYVSPGDRERKIGSPKDASGVETAPSAAFGIDLRREQVERIMAEAKEDSDPAR